MYMKKLFLPLLLLAASCTPNVISEEDAISYRIVHQTKGPDLGYSPSSGVHILQVDGYAFKDLNKNNVLDRYEDWRLSSQERAKDLASKMSLEEICGLMLYSSAQKLNSPELTEDQIAMLDKNHVRHMLVSKIKDTRTAAEWSNRVQAWCEASALGIPSNTSSDPRNCIDGSNVNALAPELDGEFSPVAASDISKWPHEFGMAATFDMDIMRQHGEMVAAEYRALGITTALSPQIDIATDPRWFRIFGTYSEDPYLTRDIARTYCDAFQTTPGSPNGWGMRSVNCMVKHWPGGGAGEAGRDAHFGIGKYAVYPGGNFELGMIPFIEGAFKLQGKTKMASAVMPYYTISYNQNPNGENVANGFSKYIIQDLLRDKYHFEGVVCSDWGIVRNYAKVYKHDGKPWGVETLSGAEKRLLCFEAGVDQLGGVKDNETSIEAYRLWERKYGPESARARFELSATRLLVNIFNVGVFENPYVDVAASVETVGNPTFMEAGYNAQIKSVVMLKNAGSVLPVANPAERRLKVYEPMRHEDEGITFWQKPTPAYDEYLISKAVLAQYFDVTDNPDEADFALVGIKGPFGHWGYSLPDKEYPDGHYLPISLQWGPYTATNAREVSLAGGDPTEASANRSYKGFTEISTNASDATLVRNTREKMGKKPVIVYVSVEKPFIPAEIEPYADALLMGCGVCNNALLDLVSGAAEPYGLLPCQLPADMQTVEEQFEDTPRDMKFYVDNEGNGYDFAYGLNWKGVINDARVKKYSKK